MMLRARERSEVRTWQTRSLLEHLLGQQEESLPALVGRASYFSSITLADSILKKLESVVTKSLLEGHYHI